MKLKNYAYRCMAVVCAFVAVACVDESFRIDEVSTEVTIGGDPTVVPLGELSRKTVGELMENVNVPGLSKDKDGNYTYTYRDNGDVINVSGLDSSFEIPKAETQFEVEMPTLGLDGYSIDFNNKETIELKFSGELLQYIPSSYTQIEITNWMLNMIAESNRKFSGHLSGEFNPDDIYLELPELIDDIHRIYFKNKETGHHGAPFHVKVHLNGLADINGGGKLNVDLRTSGAKLVLLDNKDVEIVSNADGVYHIEKDVESGVDIIDFALYVESVINEKALNSDHAIDVELAMTYDVSFELTAKAGILANVKPEVEISADFELGNADIVLNNNIDLINYDGGKGFDVEITSIPREVKSINNISFKSGTELTLFADGLEWLGDNAHAIELELTLPDYLVLHSLNGVDYDWNDQGHVITTTVKEINNGLTIGLDAIDFGSDGIVPKNGVIELHFAPKIKAHFDHDGEILVSDILPDNELVVVSVGLEKASVDIASVSGMVDYSYDTNRSFVLTGVDSSKFEVGGSGVSPVLTLEVDNPLTMDAYLTAILSPKINGVVSDDRTLEVRNAIIKKAEVKDGVVVPTKTLLIFAKAERAAEFSDPKYSFVECDIDKLMIGVLPEQIALDLELSTNPNEVATLYMGDSSAISYSYTFDVPIKLNDTLNVKYHDTLDLEKIGFGSSLSQLEDFDAFKLRNIAIIADVRTTLPLQFLANASFLDKSGNVMDDIIKLRFPVGMNSITGSEDGVNEASSCVRMELEMGEKGTLSQLANISSIRFNCELNSVAENSTALLDEQYIEATLKLELSNGVTLDLKEFI